MQRGHEVVRGPETPGEKPRREARPVTRPRFLTVAERRGHPELVRRYGSHDGVVVRRLKEPGRETHRAKRSAGCPASNALVHPEPENARHRKKPIAPIRAPAKESSCVPNRSDIRPLTGAHDQDRERDRGHEEARGPGLHLDHFLEKERREQETEENETNMKKDDRFAVQNVRLFRRVRSRSGALTSFRPSRKTAAKSRVTKTITQREIGTPALGERDLRGIEDDDEADHEHRLQERARPVELVLGLREKILGHEEVNEEQADHPDRDVDPEDTRPAESADEEAADRGPEINPALTTIAIVPSALPRSLEGKLAVMSAGPFAISIEAPTACTTRAPISKPREPAIPQSADPRVKMVKPIWKMSSGPPNPPGGRKAGRDR